MKCICKNCIHWDESFTQNGATFGDCDAIVDSDTASSITPYGDDDWEPPAFISGNGEFTTQDSFGCILFQAEVK